jgi:hypothetical protein
MKQAIWLIVGLSVGFLLAILLFGCQRLDGPSALVGEAIFGEQSILAPGYCDYKFSKILVGMSKAEVLDLIGEPLEWNSRLPREEIGHWSRACCHHNYRGRVVAFVDGRVSRIFAGYDWD